MAFHNHAKMKMNQQHNMNYADYKRTYTLKYTGTCLFSFIPVLVFFNNTCSKGDTMIDTS